MMPIVRLALFALTLAMALPFIGLLSTVGAHDIVVAFNAPGTREALRVSLLASLGAISIATLLGVPAGYLLARTSSPARALALFILALPLALPPIASGILLLGLVGTRRPLGSWLFAHGFGLVDSLGGVGLAEFFVAGSLVAIASAAAFASVDPLLEEAARTLGASRLEAMITVALPLAAPGVTAGILLAWLRALGEYGATSVLAYHPTSLPVELYVALSADGITQALALTAIFVALTATVVVLSWFARRNFV